MMISGEDWAIERHATSTVWDEASALAVGFLGLVPRLEEAWSGDAAHSPRCFSLTRVFPVPIESERGSRFLF